MCVMLIGSTRSGAYQIRLPVVVGNGIAILLEQTCLEFAFGAWQHSE